MILLRLSCEIKSLLSLPWERHSMPDERTVSCSSCGLGWASRSGQLLPSQKPVSVSCFVTQAKPYKSINKARLNRLIPVSHHGTLNIHGWTGTRGSISQEAVWVRKFKMAMKLTIETIKLRFPNVPNMSTEELCELMKAESSKRKLVLLVSCMTNSAPVLQNLCSS